VDGVDGVKMIALFFVVCPVQRAVMNMHAGVYKCMYVILTQSVLFT
jgi:hypothetical protein